MRTRYMTEDHKKALVQLRTRVAIKLHGDWAPLDGKRINTAFFLPGVEKTRENVLLWGDCRGRPTWKESYGDLFTDKKTWDEIVEAQKRNPDKSFYLIFGLPEPHGDVWFRYHSSIEGRVMVKTGGRDDRNDASDVETMVHVPFKYFLPVGRLPNVPYP